MRTLIAYSKDIEVLCLSDTAGFLSEKQAKDLLIDTYEMIKKSLRVDTMYIVTQDEKRMFTVDDIDDFLRYIQFQSKDLSFAAYLSEIYDKYKSSEEIGVFLYVTDDVPSTLNVKEAVQMLKQKLS